jgi:hypothetical protein
MKIQQCSNVAAFTDEFCRAHIQINDMETGTYHLCQLLQNEGVSLASLAE